MTVLLPVIVAALFALHGALANADATTDNPAGAKFQPSPPALQCVAFSPYVGQLDPESGTAPPKQLIETLLDTLVAQTPFRCIMTYGVIDGLEEIFPAAQARGIKVIAIVWLDNDIQTNSRSITHGIVMAKTYPDTIIKLSCGSEVRTRHGKQYDHEILRCIDAMRQAGVSQPITTIDTWWEWCDRNSQGCRKNLFANKVDWIGSNIFPWWENKFSADHPCTTADQATDFHLARLSELRQTYPDQDVIVTEFGWPYGPEGRSEINANTAQRCGIAAPANQIEVIRSTLARLTEKNWSGVVFEAFSEGWKPGNEGLFGSFWGICQGTAPYACKTELFERTDQGLTSRK